MNNLEVIDITSLSGTEYAYLPYTGFILNKQLLQSDSRRSIEYQKLEEKYKREFDKSLTPATPEEIEFYIKRFGFQELILEVTTGCNLRCEYCIFSGNYNVQRRHGKSNAEFKDLKKAIDYYYSQLKMNRLFNVNRRPTVAFYGGEPLLNYKAIKQCIDYIKEKYSEFDTFFTITTNGTLLNEDIMKYFIKNEVWLVFSLDGDKTTHNRNRKRKDGKGSFDEVFANIKKYQEMKKGIVFINSVYDYKTNLQDVIEFLFHHKNLVNLSASMVNPYGTNYFDSFSEEDVRKFVRNYSLLQNMFFKQLKDGGYRKNPETSTLNLIVGKPAMSILLRKQIGMKTNPFFPFTGACIPGEKIFVDINGTINPCEKIGKGMTIGSSDEGLNYINIANYVNKFQIILKDCFDCKYRGLCSLCYQAFWDGNRFLKDQKNCNASISNIRDALSLFVSMSELQPHWIDAYSSDFFETIQNLELSLL